MGCPNLAASGKCDSCRRERFKQLDANRPNSDARGYDADFRRLRVLCFQRDAWRCVDCGWEPNVVRDFRLYDLGPPPVEQVLHELRERFHIGERHLHCDHQIPISARPDLRLVLDNLRTRCDTCHGAKTLRESVR
jgi:hypothetical protein